MKDLVELLAWQHRAAKRDAAPFEQLRQLSRDYFNGLAVDFTTVACELPRPDTFAGAVYRACREIPYARTMSYSALARRTGRPDAARAVATAMSRNPVALVVPCHRVIYADGRPGGFSAAGGVALKQRMLDLERRAAGP
jgi:methylated-DNA-[protein]-cysteine S-methyltransferase